MTTPRKTFFAFLGLSLVAYLPSFDNAFREDDFVFLRHAAEHGWTLSALLPSADFAFYRPGALFLFLTEYAAFGLHSGAYIAFNFVVHLAIAVLFFGVLARMGVRKEVAATAAGLFLIGVGHAAKQVMWASTSGPLLAVFLSLAAISGVQLWLKTGRASALMLLTAAVALAPAFHESGIVALMLVVAYSAIYGTRKHVRWLVGISAVVTGAWMTVWFLVASSFPTYGAGVGSVLTAPVYLLRYAGFLLVPIQPWDAGGGWGSGMNVLQWIHPAIGLVVCILLVRGFRHGTNAVRFLILWFFLSIAPFCLVEFPGHWLERRYLYALALPWTAVVAFAIYRFGKFWRVVAVVGLTVATITLHLLLEHKYDRQSRAACRGPHSFAAYRVCSVPRESAHPHS